MQTELGPLSWRAHHSQDLTVFYRHLHNGLLAHLPRPTKPHRLRRYDEEEVHHEARFFSFKLAARPEGSAKIRSARTPLRGSSAAGLKSKATYGPQFSLGPASAPRPHPELLSREPRNPCLRANGSEHFLSLPHPPSPVRSKFAVLVSRFFPRGDVPLPTSFCGRDHPEVWSQAVSFPSPALTLPPCWADPGGCIYVT
jgi:hypothetical protein